MSDNQKRGPLDAVSKKFIEENSEKMSPAEIAGKLRRNPNTVRKYIQSNGLKPFRSADESDSDKIRRDLRNNPWYDGLKQQFTGAEIIYFENLWVTLNKQLECDILDSEKLQMKKYLTLELLKDRCMCSQRQKLDELELVEKELRTELNKGEHVRDKQLLKRLADRISELKNLTPALLREFKELSQEQDKVNAALKMSRDDRIKSVRDSKGSWEQVIKMLEDPIHRDRVGKHMEINRVAADRELRKLLSSHPFVDGSYDEPVQSGKYDSE